MRIINGIVCTMEGATIENGFVEIENGKISALGGMEQLLPSDTAQVYDARGGYILPGFVDAHCHLGMFGDGLGFEGDDANEATDPCTPHLRGIDGINAQDRCFADARRGGVTTVLSGPGSANPLAGQFVAMKTAGQWVDQMVLCAPVAMKIALGENPKVTYNERHEGPITRMATAALLREYFEKAKQYAQKLDLAVQEEEDEPDFDPKLHALIPVLKGELPVHIHAHRADDIATGIRLCNEFGIRCVIVHGTEAHLVAPLIKSTGCPVITGPCLGDRSKPELANMTANLPAILYEEQIPFAICTDHPETPIQHLPLCAAMAVRAGLNPQAALCAITRWPAEICGLGDRIGSLAVGKDADIVVTQGHPLNWMSKICAVFIDGKQVTD